ncbi:unnamed protein product [Paramecium primaurelia]|uniref:Uncharacterized protein n=1 Tax=Paramecium primaurelia TaxID=5886 RepID=A0A8S1L0C8_PARPR|nr:unnamed protein product [Paramecium primaurelia]
MNLNRIPLAPLTPMQVQQLARLPKVQNNQNQLTCPNTIKNNLEYSKCSSTNYQFKIYKKIVLELLNSMQIKPFLEFIYGLHFEFKTLFHIHICPTQSLINFLNLHYDIKQLYKVYDSIYKQNVTKIKIYLNISEIDLILQLLRSIVKQMPHISRIREVLKNQTVRDLISIKNTQIEDPKLNQIITMIQYIFNSSLTKINSQIIVKKELQENIQKDQSFEHIQSNVQQVIISLFLQYCLQSKIILPEIIYSIVLSNTNSKNLTLDPSFVNDIPDSKQYDEFKEKIKYRKYQRISNLQGLIEYEDHIISEFQISYPMKNLENDLLQTINLVLENYQLILDRLIRIFSSKRIGTTLQILGSNSLSQIGMKIFNTILDIEKALKKRETIQKKRIPKIKLKIQKI